MSGRAIVDSIAIMHDRSTAWAVDLRRTASTRRTAMRTRSLFYTTHSGRAEDDAQSTVYRTVCRGDPHA